MAEGKWPVDELAFDSYWSVRTELDNADGTSRVLSQAAPGAGYRLVICGGVLHNRNAGGVHTQFHDGDVAGVFLSMGGATNVTIPFAGRWELSEDTGLYLSMLVTIGSNEVEACVSGVIERV